MAETIGFTQENISVTVATPLADDVFRVRSIRGEEALSGLFRYELELLSEDGAVDFKAIVGQQVSVAIEFSDQATKRYVTGIVTDFSQHDHDARFWLYRAVVRPPFWLATRSSGCQIFQDKSVTDIAEAVLGDLGITDYSLETTATYAARDYCVQYNESAFDFLNRLFEDEGIFYFFRHAQDACTLVIADDADAHVPCPGLTKAQYRPGRPQQDREEEDAIFQTSYTERVVTDAYAADDFNFETPSTQLYSEVEGEGSGSGMEVYEYPGGYTAKDAGDGRTDLRMQELEAPMKELSGRAHCKAFIAGYAFTLAGHERADLDQDYVLRRLRLTATPERYENSFEAFPKSLPFRAPRLTPRPRIRGVQTAMVAGPSGEEIWTDKYGRIKCKFHWDQLGPGDDKASCWIRVAQSWAGKQWGGWILPRIGMEVVVTFLEGDPDRPLVTGCIYNGEAMPPYTLPDDQTKSTMKSNSSKGGDGYNEWRFEDKAGDEEIWLHAQKDWNTVVENDRNTTLNDGNDTLTVKKGDRTSKIQKGSEDHYVKSTRTLQVDGAQKHKTGNTYTHNVVGDFTLKVDGDISIEATGKITIKSGKDMTLDCGANMVQKSKEKFDSSAGMAMSHTAKQDLSQKSDMNVKTEAGMDLTAKAGMNLNAEGGMNTTVKAGMNLNAEGGIGATVKGAAMGTFDGGAMATVKGALVKLN